MKLERLFTTSLAANFQVKLQFVSCRKQELEMTMWDYEPNLSKKLRPRDYRESIQ